MGILSGSMHDTLVWNSIALLFSLVLIFFGDTVCVALQLVNHGIPVELLDRVKKVCAECYKLREEGFKESKPVQMLKEMVDREGEGLAVNELDDMDWEDVFTLQDDNQWPSNPPEFK